jgi:hypothetical protein
MALGASCAAAVSRGSVCQCTRWLILFAAAAAGVAATPIKKSEGYVCFAMNQCRVCIYAHHACHESLAASSAPIHAVNSRLPRHDRLSSGFSLLQMIHEIALKQRVFVPPD